MFNDSKIMRISKYLNIDFTKFPFEDFKRGINIEIEHGFDNKDYGLLVFEDFLSSKLK